MYKGRLKSWNDDRGFGFIKSDELGNDVFIHISALKGPTRKPRVGDTIHFDVEQQSNGKQRATQCSIEGVQRAAPRQQPNNYRKRTVTGLLADWFLSVWLPGRCMVIRNCPSVMLYRSRRISCQFLKPRNQAGHRPLAVMAKPIARK